MLVMLRSIQQLLIIRNMIEPTFDLCNSHDNSFGAPDTPKFTNEQHTCHEIGFGFVLEKGSGDDIIKPFILEEECSFQELEISVSLSMANQFNDGNNRQINNQMPASIGVEDVEFEPLKSTSFIISNHIDKPDKPRNGLQKPLVLKSERTGVQSKQDSQSLEKSSNKGTRLNMLFLDQQISSVLPEERDKRRQLWFSEQDDSVQESIMKVSFILKNEPQKENLSKNDSIQPQRKTHDEKMNEIAQINPFPQINQNKQVQLEMKPIISQVANSSNSLLNNQPYNKDREVQDSHVIQSENDCLKFFLLSIEQKEQQIEVYQLESSSEDKQNKPQAISQLPHELPIIPEENSTSLNDQSGTSELVLNLVVDESTFIHSSFSERQESISENNPKQQLYAINKSSQIRENSDQFWEVTIIEKKSADKRQRRRPCQYWVGESVRYLKNNQVMTCYRRKFEEVFLKLNHPQEIEEATTILAQTYYMKGSLTMKPRSKININPIEGKITLKNSKRNVYFIFNQHEVLISNSIRGSNKLCLNNPQIHSIRNSLNQNCNIIVTIYKERSD